MPTSSQLQISFPHFVDSHFIIIEHAAAGPLLDPHFNPSSREAVAVDGKVAGGIPAVTNRYFGGEPPAAGAPPIQPSGFVIMVVWQRCLHSIIREVGTKIEHNRSHDAILYSTFTRIFRFQGQVTHPYRLCDIASTKIPEPFYLYSQRKGFVSSKSLFADAESMEPVSSPLIPFMGDGGQANTKGLGPKKSSVQAIKKAIRQSPKKVNLVAKLVRGMRVEDALLQLQVLVKRAAKTVYEVIHSARANASHNHGLDPDKLIVAEAFVGKGLYLKRISYHAKGRSGIMVRPKCRLTVVVRETTPEEEAKIAKLRVMNYKKLTRKEKQLVPHQLIEVRPRWSRKRNDESASTS